MITTCGNCGGLRTTEPFEMYAGTPCTCDAQARTGAQREMLTLLQGLIEQLGAHDAAHVAVGHLQAQLGMTRPLAEVRERIKQKSATQE